MVFTQVTQLHFLSYRYDEMVVGSLVTSCALPVRQNRGKHHYLFEKIIRKKLTGILSLERLRFNFFSCGPVLSDKQFIYLFLQFMVCTHVKTKHVIIGN